MLKSLLLAFTATILLLHMTVDGGLLSKLKNKGKKSTPNCALPTNSPQFAELCLLTSVLPLFQNLTASQVCDADCRCTHGARAGGTCGTVNGKTVCKCDYESAATPSVIPNECSLFSPVAGTLCMDSTPITGKFLNGTFCNADCVCSHGFKANGKKTMRNMCNSKNGVSGNTQTYCVCNNAKNP